MNKKEALIVLEVLWDKGITDKEREALTIALSMLRFAVQLGDD